MKHLLLDLARIECRLASLSLAGGKSREGAALLSRAMWLLRLRDASRATSDAGAVTPPLDEARDELP